MHDQETLDELRAMSVDELQQEYQDCIKEYKEWINKQLPFNYGWDDEHFYIVTIRDLIDQIQTVLQEKGIIPEKSKVSELDKQYRSSVNKSKDASYSFTFRRDDISKDKWWWWVDQEI